VMAWMEEGRTLNGDEGMKSRFGRKIYEGNN
jgi:hypothetical protein